MQILNNFLLLFTLNLTFNNNSNLETIIFHHVTVLFIELWTVTALFCTFVFYLNVLIIFRTII
jgi:hypothetical protein